MTLEATSNLPVTTGRAAEPLIHPRWVRITHWINALAIFMMVGSGWQIYDASPLFRFIYFPSQFALGEWLAGALLWHFAAMWLFVINFTVYVTLGIFTGRFRRKLLPIRPRDVWNDLSAALRGKLSHDDLSVYNAVQRLLYLGVILAGIVVVLRGIRGGGRPLTEDDPVPSKLFAPSGLIPTAAEREVQRQWDTLPAGRHAG